VVAEEGDADAGTVGRAVHLHLTDKGDAAEVASIRSISIFLRAIS